MKHSENMKHHETLVKRCETSRNTRTVAIRCDDIGAQCGDIGAKRSDSSARHGDIGARVEFRMGDISDCRVTPTLQSHMENWNQDLPERYSKFHGLYIKFQGHGKWPCTW